MSHTATRPGVGAERPEFVPYVYGAASGRPSPGRPERVLANRERLESVALRFERELGERPAGPVAVRPRGRPPAPDLSPKKLQQRRRRAERKAQRERDARACPACKCDPPDHFAGCSAQAQRLAALDEALGTTAPETRRTLTRCRKCGYPKGGPSCQVMHGGRG